MPGRLDVPDSRQIGLAVGRPRHGGSQVHFAVPGARHAGRRVVQPLRMGGCHEQTANDNYKNASHSSTVAVAAVKVNRSRLHEA